MGLYYKIGTFIKNPVEVSMDCIRYSQSRVTPVRKLLFAMLSSLIYHELIFFIWRKNDIPFSKNEFHKFKT